MLVSGCLEIEAMSAALLTVVRERMPIMTLNGESPGYMIAV